MRLSEESSGGGGESAAAAADAQLAEREAPAWTPTTSHFYQFNESGGCGLFSSRKSSCWLLLHTPAGADVDCCCCCHMGVADAQNANAGMNTGAPEEAEVQRKGNSYTPCCGSRGRDLADGLVGAGEPHKGLDDENCVSERTARGANPPRRRCPRRRYALRSAGRSSAGEERYGGACGIAARTMKRKRTPTTAVQRSLLVSSDVDASSCGTLRSPASGGRRRARSEPAHGTDSAGGTATSLSDAGGGGRGQDEEDLVESDACRAADSTPEGSVDDGHRRILRADSGHDIHSPTMRRECCEGLIMFLHKQNSLNSSTSLVQNLKRHNSCTGSVEGAPRGNAVCTGATRQTGEEDTDSGALLATPLKDSPVIPSDSPLIIINLVRAHGYHSILLHASREGNTQVISLLAKAGVDFNIHDDDGSTPLIFASDAGRVATARELLGNGANVNTRDRLGRSALTYAMYRGRLDVVRLLLEFGADASLFDVDGCTPLMYGAARGSTTCCAALLDIVSPGLDIDCRNKDGFTALVYALECGHVDTGKELLQRGARADSRSANGSTCLHWAATCGQVESCMVLLGLRGVVDVNARNARGITPLMYATARGQERSTRLLLDHGADIHAQDSEGSTPLMYACYRGFSRIALMLLSNGADFYATNLRGATPLMYAAARGKRETCFELFRWAEERCAGDVEEMRSVRLGLVDARDSKGFKAADWARHGGYTNTEELLDVATTGVPVRWSRRVNRLFPEDFKERVRCLLLSMQRIGMQRDVVDTIIERFATLSIWNVV